MRSNDEYLTLLETTFELYSQEISKMCESDQGNIFPVDLFFVANIQRSQFLVQGFTLLIKAKNFFAAAPLIRLHLDNLLHIYAVSIFDKPHILATNLVRGKKRLKDYRDKTGQKLTDNYLIKLFFSDPINKEFDALEKVYFETSKFVHFSEKHYAANFMNQNPGKIMLLAQTYSISETEERAAIQAMIMITRAQIEYLRGWTHSKNFT